MRFIGESAPEAETQTFGRRTVLKKVLGGLLGLGLVAGGTTVGYFVFKPEQRAPSASAPAEAGGQGGGSAELPEKLPADIRNIADPEAIRKAVALALDVPESSINAQTARSGNENSEGYGTSSWFSAKGERQLQISVEQRFKTVIRTPTDALADFKSTAKLYPTRRQIPFVGVEAAFYDEETGAVDVFGQDFHLGVKLSNRDPNYPAGEGAGDRGAAPGAEPTTTKLAGLLVAEYFSAG